MTKRQRLVRDCLAFILTVLFMMGLNQPVTQYDQISYSSFLTLLEEGDINEVGYNQEMKYALVHQVSTDTRFKVSIVSDENFVNDIYEYSVSLDNFKYEAIKEVQQLGLLSKLLFGFAFCITLRLVITSVCVRSNLKRSKSGKNVDIETDNKNEKMSGGFIRLFEGYKPKKVDDTEVKFSDVIGLEKQIEELQDIVSFLKEPEKYQAVGAKLPKGVLLHGKSGVGKTLIARAIAGEANVSFYAITASELQSKFLGESEERIRSVFEQAEQNAPAIIFIDEIDSIATKRYSDHSNRYAASIVNQLLACMDGFDKDTNVIVIAATNYFSVLDDALLRSGRFDKHIYIHEPDREARRKLIEYYSKDKAIDDMMNIEKIIDLTSGLTGADIETILNEAAILCVRKGEDFITEEDVMEAFRKVEIGIKNTYTAPSKEKLERTAIHESGHAIVAHCFGQIVSEISIIARGNAAGYNLAQSEEEYNFNFEELKHRIMCLLGGRAAEEVYYDDVSTGASDDLKRASSLIRDMFLRFAMNNEKGISLVLTDDKSFNDVVVKDSYEKMNEFMETVYDETKGIIAEKEELLEVLSKRLLEEETLSKAEIEEIFSEEGSAEVG